MAKLDGLVEGTPTKYTGDDAGPMLVAWIDATTLPAGQVIGDDDDSEDEDEDEDEGEDEDKEEPLDSTIIARGRRWPSVKKMTSALNRMFQIEFLADSPCSYPLAYDKIQQLKKYTSLNSTVGFDIAEHLHRIVLGLRSMSGWSPAERCQNSCMFLHRICHAMRQVDCAQNCPLVKNLRIPSEGSRFFRTRDEGGDGFPDCIAVGYHKVSKSMWCLLVAHTNQSTDTPSYFHLSSGTCPIVPRLPRKRQTP